LSKYAGWFIPLKIESSGPAWSEWRSKYSYEGKTIPIVFVIRADGEKLYGKSGSLPGNELYQLLNSSLNNSGVLLDDRQLSTINETIQKTEKLLADDKPLAAVKQLMRISKIGTPGQIGCYANVAVAADDLAIKLTEKATATLEAARKLIEDPETRFDGLADALKCANTYGRLPSINKQAKAMRAQWNRDDDLKATLKQVKQFQKLEKQIQKGKVSRKLDAIRAFVKKYSDNDAMTGRAIGLIDDVVKSELAQNKGETVNWVTKSSDSFEGLLVVNFGDDGAIIIKMDDGKSKTVKIDDLDRVSQAVAKCRDDED
jgi:hypothetical protein